MQAKRALIIGVLLGGAHWTMAQTPDLLQAPEPTRFQEWQRAGATAHGEEFTLSFRSSEPSPYEENNVVPLHVMLPRDRPGPVPAVLLLHYWGAMDQRVERQMAAELNRRGVAAVLMALPYHLERTPSGRRSGELAILPDIAHLRATMIQSLQDARRAIDFISSRPELDQRRVGVAGTSLGAIIATMVYSVDTRVTHASFVLGGVDLAHLLWNSSRVVPQREALRRLGYTEGKLREELAEIEPLRFLPQRAPGRTFVIGARYDTVVPPASTARLLEALSHPTVLWIETGHYGGFFVQRRLFEETARFFGEEFHGRAYEPPERISAPTLRLTVQYNLGTGMDIGVGVDLLAVGKHREYTATALLTPRGARLFLGRRLDRSIAVGVSSDVRGATFGVLWSAVL